MQRFRRRTLSTSGTGTPGVAWPTRIIWVGLALAAVRRAEHLQRVARCRRARGCARRWRRRRGSSGSSPPAPSLPFSISRPHSQPNWNLLRESSIDHEKLVSHQHAVLDAARPCSSKRRVAGLDVQVRHAVDRRPVPAAGARVGDAGRPARTCEIAPPSGRSRMPSRIRSRLRAACRRRRRRSSRAPRGASGRR